MIKQIIGLTGPIRAGKSSVLNLLEEKGYKGYRFSDAINKEIKKRGKKIERKLQQDIGNEFRKKFGGDYWAKKLLKIASRENTEKIIVDGIRNPAEIKFLKRNGAIIIGVNAGDEIRKKRFLETEKDFELVNKRDRGVGENEFGQQVKECLDLSDIVIMNNYSSIEPLKKDVDKILLKISS